jgi:hypothetical protein
MKYSDAFNFKFARSSSAAPPQTPFEFGSVRWHRILSAGRGQFLLQFSLVAFHEFEEQSGDRATTTGFAGALESNPAQEFPGFGREVDPGRAVRAFFGLRPRWTGFGFNHVTEQVYSKLFVNCEL